MDRNKLEKQFQELKIMVDKMLAGYPKEQPKKVEIGPNEYQCAQCKGIFEYMRSDEEVLAEMQNNFPNLQKEDSAIICDDCYKEIFN